MAFAPKKVEEKNKGAGKRRRTNKTKEVENKSVEEVEYEHVSPPWNFSWVVAGEICGCAWPESEANMKFLKSEGVGVLVSLSEERQPPRTTRHLLDCHLIPVVEFEDPSMEQISHFIDICDKAREEKKGVCVHCRMGRGRTGVMLACYLMKYYNQIPSSAMTNVRLMRPYSIETREQERAVKTYWDYMAWGHV